MKNAQKRAKKTKKKVKICGKRIEKTIVTKS